MSDDAAMQKARATTRFNTMAADFDQQGAFARFGRRPVEVVGVEPGHRVFDVATGRGAALFPAAKRGWCDDGKDSPACETGGDGVGCTGSIRGDPAIDHH